MIFCSKGSHLSHESAKTSGAGLSYSVSQLLSTHLLRCSYRPNLRHRPTLSSSVYDLYKLRRSKMLLVCVPLQLSLSHWSLEESSRMTGYRTILLDACVVCATITFSLLLRRRKAQRRLPLPPGPRRLPFVGNMFQVPTAYLWETALEWGKVYGEAEVLFYMSFYTLTVPNSRRRHDIS